LNKLREIWEHMRLLSFRPVNLKWEFVIEFRGEQKTILLKEKHHWPMIIGAEITLVEKWLLKEYGSLCYLAFGILA